jgi:hypothetical protein
LNAAAVSLSLAAFALGSLSAMSAMSALSLLPRCLPDAFLIPGVLA